MTTSSKAEPATPDASLAPDAPYSHRGLTYPLGRTGPEAGAIIPLAEGIGWTRSPVPGSLNHINLWVLDDGDGVALVDTGLKMPAAREAWEALFAGPLAGRKVTRVICTHFHPDHLGLAGWLCERFGVRLWMTRGEWLFARMLTTDIRDTPPAEAFAYRRGAGWERRADRRRGREGLGPLRRDGESGAGRLCGCRTATRSGSGRGLAGRDRLRPFARTCLPGRRCGQDHDRGRSGAAADHLERFAEPFSEPRATRSAMAGLDREAEPAARRPARPALARRALYGLHARLDALAAGHRGRLDALDEGSPSRARAVDCFSILFGRKIEDGSFGLATGEAMAHLRHLEVEGRAVREERDGVYWYRAASLDPTAHGTIARGHG